MTLARDGFRLVINYRTDKEHAERLCALISSNGGKAIPVQADVFSPDGCAALVNETVLYFDRIDAYIIGPGAEWSPKLPSPSYSYNAAKNARISAIIGLTDWCWKHRITVNMVAPGPVDHIPSLDDAVHQAAAFPAGSPKISPQDIAEIIAFLCSDEGRYITGNVIGTQF